MRTGKPREDLTGKTIGYLQVLELAPKDAGRFMWKCLCVCGNIFITRDSRLHSGRCKSCGCMKGKLTAEKVSIHGQYLHPLYSTWSGMHSRCNNKNQKSYEGYGGRGINICERWYDVNNFIEDMGQKPSKQHKLERIDNDADYCPENCRWATNIEQANNTRKNRFLEYKGQTKSITEWARIVGIDSRTISYRILHGWSVEDALETKPKFGNRTVKDKNNG